MSTTQHGPSRASRGAARRPPSSRGALCGLGLLLASCSSLARAEPAPPTSPPPAGVPAGSPLALTDLGPAELELFWRVAKGEICPCGEPTSLARCLEAPAPCARALAIGRQLHDWVKSGLSYSQVMDRLIAGLEQLAQVKSIALEGIPCAGVAGAPVKVVSFSDFQCPFCRKAAQLVAKLEQEHYHGKIQHCFKHFPLSYHADARFAATVAEVAHEQGKFWPFHDKMFEAAGRGELTEETIRQTASDLGVPTEGNDEQLRRAAARVNQQLQEGREIGVGGTPDFYVNGRPIPANEPLEPALRRLIDEELLRLATEAAGKAP